MIVYVDVLLFINTVINYAVLLTAEKLLKADVRLWRQILGAFTGALFSLSIFLELQNAFFLFLLKILSSLLLTFITFGYHGRREFIKSILLTLSVSLFYCGFIILFYQLFKPPNMLIVNDVVYLELNPLLMLALTGAIYGILLLLERLLRERIKASIVQLRFTVNGTEYSCIGKVDTGCNVVEPFSSSPVIITDNTVFSIPEGTPSRIIPYSTLSGSSYLTAVKAERVEIDRTAVNKAIYIAVTSGLHNSFQAIINSDILR